MGYGKEKTLEQKQLEEARSRIMSQLDEFYEECAKKVERSAQDIREYAADLEDLEKALKAEKEKNAREVRARTILDGIGRQLASLYNTVSDMPKDDPYRKPLIDCINRLNSEFANYGVGVIYHYEQMLARRDKDVEVKNIAQVGDKSLDGIVRCNKIGFRIGNEAVINEEVTECSYDPAFDKESQREEQISQRPADNASQKPMQTAPRQTKNEDNQCPFSRGTDFVTRPAKIEGKAQNCIEIISTFMQESFKDMSIWTNKENGRPLVPLNKHVRDTLGHQQYFYYRAKLYACDAYCLQIDGKILCLYLWKNQYNLSDAPECIPLAKL